MERVLITGGAGFIGSHLAERMLSQGISVTILDDLSTGHWSNVQHLEGRAGFRALVANARERDLVEAEVQNHDVVYHLASAVGVKLIMEQPVKTIETIFHATDVVFSACTRYRRPVVLTSTSEVYGKSPNIPFREQDDVVMGSTEKRRWAYACAKALDEFLALAHFHETQLPVYVVRLFNTVGARQTGQYGMVLPNFVQQALAGDPITIHGDGSQRRCFCSVRDVVTGLVALPEKHRAQGMVINLGSQEETTIKELAERVVAVTGSDSIMQFVPYEDVYGAGFDDMQQRVPDLTRSKELLGWEPTVSLDEIIQEVVDFQRGIVDR